MTIEETNGAAFEPPIDCRVGRDLKPEDFGLPPYPEGEVVGPCVCGSWPGGKCFRCKVVPNAKVSEGER